jgi:hypothetical protein
MVFSMSPEMLTKAKEMGSHFSVEVERDPEKGTMKVKIIPKDDIGRKEVPGILDGLANQLCTQFYTFFGVESKIIELE